MPRYNNPRKTWQYSTEFKAKAAQLTLIDGIMVKDVAETLDFHPMMLSRWRKEYRERKFVGNKVKKWQRFLAEQHQNDIDSSRQTPEA
jgi:transposase